MYAVSRFKVSHKINTGKINSSTKLKTDVKLHSDDVGPPKPLD